MSVKEDRDFLDILRFLNRENINQSPELSDSFFQSLIVFADNVPASYGKLTDKYFRLLEEEYMGNIAKNFILSTLFAKEIRKQLTKHFVQDKVNCLYIDNRDAANVISYVGCIKE